MNTTHHNTTQHTTQRTTPKQIMRKFIITRTPILLVVLIIVVVATLVVTSASASASASSTASRGTAIATSASSTSTSAAATAAAAAAAVVNNDNNELLLLWAEKLLSRFSNRRNDDHHLQIEEDEEDEEEEAQLLRYLQITEDKDENENEDKDLYVNFLQLLDPQKSDNSTVSNIIDQLKEYINGDGNAVNNLINQFLLPTDSSSGSEDDANEDANSSSSSSASAKISFNIPDGFLLDLGIGGSSVNLTSVTVGGLNTFTLINLLQPVTVSSVTSTSYESPRTIIQNNFTMNELYLDLNLIETITTTSGSTESFVSMRLPFQDVTMTALPIRFEIIIEAIKQMPMGALLNYENYLMICLSKIIQELEIIEMDIQFGIVDYPIMFSNSNNRTSTPFFDAITSLFIGLPIAVPIFFNTTIRNIINDLIYDNILDIDSDNDSSNTAVTCPSYPTTIVNDNSLIDYRTFFNEGLPLMIKDLIDTQLIATNPSTGLPKMNDVVIEPFIGSNMTWNGNGNGNGNDRDNDIDYSNYLLNTNGNIQLGGLDADYKFSIESIQIQNINTMIQPLEILSIIENQPYQLNNTITMGLPLEDKPISISVNKLYFAILTDGT